MRALRRLPLVHILDVRLYRLDRGGPAKALVGLGRKSTAQQRAAHQRRALGIKTLILHGRNNDDPDFSDEGVPKIPETYRRLEHLELWNVTVTDATMAAIGEHLSSSLQTFSLTGCVSIFRDALTDAGGVEIGKLGFLKTLRIHDECLEFTDVTFNALGVLKDLEELDLSYSLISDAAVCNLSRKLPKLRELNLSSCGDITGEVSSALPRSLAKLNLGSSGAVMNGMPRCVFERMPNLTFLDVSRSCEMDDLSFLAPIAPHLEVLRLSQSDTCDASIARWLPQMPNLEELDLDTCSISDAAVCTPLPTLLKLRVLKLSYNSSITSAIFSALPGSLVELDLDQSHVMSALLPNSALENLPNLTKFSGSSCDEVDDLSFLAPVAPHLQVLGIAHVGASDAKVAHLVSQMPNLVELDLTNAAAVSDETACAISSLGNVQEAFPAHTQIGNAGVRAIVDGAAFHSLRVLQLEGCPIFVDSAVHALRMADISVTGEAFETCGFFERVPCCGLF